MKTLQIIPEINLKKCLLWQYNNAPALRALILQKQDWYKTHQEDFWNYWYNSVFNLDTADDFGLTVWGEILDFPRQVKSADGSLHVLTTEQYRTVLKGQMLKFNMGVTAPEVNKWLSVVFGAQGKAYCLDNLDMTAIPFVFEQSPSDAILWLLSNVDFLPRPAGVGYEVRLIGQDIFGFNGSGLQPFNQGTFYKNWNQDLDIEHGQYQLSINAPEGATVIINGISGNYQSMTEGTEYTYSIEREGFLPYTGAGILNQDTEITIYQCEIKTNVPDCDITINGESAFGIYFLKGTSVSISYTVSKMFYQTVSKTSNVSGPTYIRVLLKGFYSIGKTISNNLDSSIMTIFSETIPYKFKINSQLKGGGGDGNYYYPGERGGTIYLTANSFQAGTNVKVLAISGGEHSFRGGVGLALSIDDKVIAVAGGGASSFAGGGGYVGGFSANGNFGFNINGNLQPSYSANNRNGNNGEAFGGSINGNFGGTSFKSNTVIFSDFSTTNAFSTEGYFNLTLEESKE